MTWFSQGLSYSKYIYHIATSKMLLDHCLFFKQQVCWGSSSVQQRPFPVTQKAIWMLCSGCSVHLAALKAGLQTQDTSEISQFWVWRDWREPLSFVHVLICVCVCAQAHGHLQTQLTPTNSLVFSKTLYICLCFIKGILNARFAKKEASNSGY